MPEGELFDSALLVRRRRFEEGVGVGGREFHARGHRRPHGSRDRNQPGTSADRSTQVPAW